MWTELSLALSDSLSAAGRRALLISLTCSVALMSVLWIGVTTLLAMVQVSRLYWLDTAIETVGSLAGLLIAWLLFPIISTVVLGFFIDPFIAATERTHYPEHPPAERGGFGEFLASALWLALLGVALNLALLPVYFLPVLGAALYLLLNGYLVGRQCFESVALRRIRRTQARIVWHQNRGRLWAAGLIIAVLLSLPIVNLIAPLIGIALMLHLFENLRCANPTDAGA